MNNPNEIEIALIKNLELVYFYNTESDSYIGLNIVYDGGKNLKYDYTYEYFDLFVAKVVNEYKKNKNVRFLDEKSKEWMESLAKNDFEKKESVFVDERISKYNSRKFDIQFVSEYIKEAIYQFLKCMENEDIEITSFNGFRDRYAITYKYANIELVIPLLIIKQDDNHYLIKFRYINDYSMSFNGDLVFYNDCIALNYSNNDKTLTGKNLYSINESQELIKYCGKFISYEEVDTKNIDNEIIDFYLNLLGLPLIQKRIKTVDNNYLLIDNIDENTKYFIHISINKDYVNVIVNKCYGMMKDELFVPLEEEKSITNIILEQDNNLVIEKHYLQTPVSTGEYKRNYENKYNYEFYEIDNNDLTKQFNKTKKKSIK